MKARGKASKAEDTSDLQTEAEDCQPKKRTRRYSLGETELWYTELKYLITCIFCWRNHDAPYLKVLMPYQTSFCNISYLIIKQIMW